ncbi:ubiquitin-specific protease doa4, partial [Tieghemiomyces parasiticus]
MAKANGSLASKPVSLAGRPINGVLSQPEPTVSRPPPPSESVDPRSQVAHLSPAAAPNNTRCSSPPTETTTVPSSAPSTVGTVNSLSSSLSPSSSMYLKPGEKGLYAEILRARAQSAATSRNNSISSVRSDMSRSGDRDSGKDIPQQLPSPQPRPAVPTSSTAGEEHRARRKALPPLPHANRSTVSETAASPPAEFSTDEFRQDFPLAPSPPPELDLASFQRSATNNTSATTKTAASTEFRHPVPLSASDVSFPLSTTVTAEALHRYLAHSPAAERPTVLLLDVRPKSLCDAARIAHAYRIHLDPEWVVDANVTTADLERHLRQRPTGDGGAASDWFGQRDRFDLLVMYDADGAGVPQRTLPSSLIPVPSTSGGSPLTETAETTQVTPLQRLFTVIYERAFTCMPQRMPVFLEGGFAAWKRFARAHPRLLPTLIEPPSALSLPAQPSSTASIATAVPSTTTTTSPTNRPAPEVQPSGQPINRDIYDFLKRSGSRTQPAAAKPSARPVDGP